MNRMATTIVSGFLIAAAATAAPAAAEDEAPPDPFTRFTACAAMTDDAARLSCYDGVAESLKAVIADRQALKAAQANAFGAEDFAGDEKLEEMERLARLASPVTKIKVGADRRLTITLANGQVWRQDSKDRPLPRLKDGVERTAEIRRVMFGRYDLILEPEGRTIRVDRIE